MTSTLPPSAHTIMVLYTGGTIGMQASANGLAPASGFEARMSDYLASQPQLNVPAWRFREMAPLIDSANMTPAYWQRLHAAVIDAVDQGCEGVLILHGTDTLAYSAAAMSFQLLEVPAAVLFTGSMLPAGVPDSDAWENLGGALAALGDGLAHGVQLYFHGELLSPNHCAKIRSFGRHPFATLQRNGGVERLDRIPEALNYRRPKAATNIGVLPLVPGITAAQLDGLIDSGIQALILECYGSGTGPSDNPEFLASLTRARDRGVVVVAITQCHEGGVELGVYEAGSRLRDAGVLSGGGMTREATLGKLNALIGGGLEVDDIRRLIGVNLCGELG